MINPRLITNNINLRNVDRIGWATDSHGEGYYYIKGKSLPSRISELTDYNHESIGTGGNTCLNLVDKIKNNTPRYHASLGWQDFKPTRAFLLSFENDMAQNATDSSIFQSGMRELIKTVRYYGAEPIVLGKWRDAWITGYEAGVSSMCADLGVQYWGIRDYCKFLNNKDEDGGGYIPYWNGPHPGTRTGFIMVDQYFRIAQAMPRPIQSLKIFRKIPSVTVNTLADLSYTDMWSRMQLFKEIQVGHSAIVNVATYDDIDAMTYGDFETINSEYLTIMGSGNVAFSEYMLVECVLPATRPNINKVKLNLSATGTAIYILKDGVWTQITGGETTDLDGCVEYDKVKFLVYKSGGFNLSDISVDWEGIEGKNLNVFNKAREISSGTELLTNNKFDVATGLTVIGTLTPSDAPDGICPDGCTKIVTVDADNYFRFSVPNAAGIPGVKETARIGITARYYPTEASADINEYSFDWAQLKIMVKGQLSGGTTTSYYSTTKYIGLHWAMAEMYIDLPYGTEGQEITVMGVDRPVQIAYRSAVK